MQKIERLSIITSGEYFYFILGDLYKRNVLMKEELRLDPSYKKNTKECVEHGLQKTRVVILAPPIK
jgi:hypothetical protein